jgi:hypothetical protein
MAKLNIDNNTELVIQGVLMFGMGGILLDEKNRLDLIQEGVKEEQLQVRLASTPGLHSQSR